MTRSRSPSRFPKRVGSPYSGCSGPPVSRATELGLTHGRTRVLAVRVPLAAEIGKTGAE